MGTIPDLDTVRGYVRVPASSLSDEDLERMRLACLADQAARCMWFGALGAAITLAVDDMTATLAVHSGLPGRGYVVNWGDGTAPVTATADDAGAASVAYVYPRVGDWAIWVRDAATGDTLGAVTVTVPGQSAAVDVSFPDALAQALLRRVQREIAARNLPLGMVGLEAEYGPANIPAFDALIEHHEHAFRRVVLA